MRNIWKNLVGMPLLGIALASTVGVGAVAADNTLESYYKSVGNITGEALADELNSLVSSTHKHQLSYDDLWDLYGTSDVYPGTTKIWDTYSEVLFNKGTDQAGTYKKEGDAYNREHTVPQSWFGEAFPMKGDAFHVLATDGYVNNRRSSFVYGEVSSASYTSNNGSKLGSSALSSFSGTVFEPIDEYKGDIARGYFYMAIRYKDKVGNWTKGDAQSVFKGSFPYLTNYAVDLFTKWSHLDPVSDKEIIRNDAVADEQGNRNPFIDHPEWVDSIWTNTYVDTPTVTAYSAVDVQKAINDLTTSSSDNAVYTAYAKYCRLNSNDKLLLDNTELLFSKVKGKSGTGLDLSSFWSEIIARNNQDQTVDMEKVNEVITLIDSLPATITLEDEAIVTDVENAYSKLNRSERKEVTNYSKLAEATVTLKSLKNKVLVQEIIDEIDNLPDPITIDDVETVRKLYEKYVAIDNDLVPYITNVAKLTTAMAIVRGLETKTYELVTDASTLAVGDKVIIIAPNQECALGPVTGNYRDRVSVSIEDNKISVEKESPIVICTLEAGLTDGTFAFNTGNGYLRPADSSTTKNYLNTEDSISAYSSYKITIENNYASIASTGNSSIGTIVYDTKHADFCSGASITASGSDVVSIYREAGALTVDQEKVDAMIALIDSFNNPITLEEYDAVHAAYDAYVKFNLLERNAVTNCDVLFAALDRLVVLTDQSRADVIIEKINELPSEFTVLNYRCTEEVRYLYEAEGPVIQAYVSNYDHLVAVEKQIQEEFGALFAFEESSTKTSMKFNYTTTVEGTSEESYELVQNAADLKVGDVIVIVGAKGTSTFAMGAQNGKFRKSVQVTVSGNVVTPTSDVSLITIEAGKSENTFALKVSDGYLYAPSEKNSLKVQDSIDDNSSWTITIKDGKATIMANKKPLQYNAGDPRFACYDNSGQTYPSIYKKSGGSKVTASVSDVYLRFGGAMEKDDYESLLSMGTNVKFGIELAKNGLDYSKFYLDPVSVASVGALNVDENGKYVQYAALIPVAANKYDTYIYARCFVEIDGTVFYMEAAGYSASALAKYYISNSESLGISGDLIKVLEVFSA